MIGIALSLGYVSRGLIRASRERALVSICSFILLTCMGLPVILSVIGSRVDERFVGAGCYRCLFRLKRLKI